jgi:hypothetical protein
VVRAVAMIDLLVFGVFMWAVIEVVRRSAITGWRMWRMDRRPWFQSVYQRQRYMAHLRRRENP